MDNKLNQLNKCYEDIKIPNELDAVINDAINRRKKDKVINLKSKRNIYFKRIGVTAASLVVALGISVNASSTLAENVYKIPVIGQVGKIITFREYSINNGTSIGEVSIPRVENVDNKVVENLVNDMIQDKVKAIVEEQAILDAEYKEAYLETGGTEEDYQKVEMTVDYKKHYASKHILSFEIFKYQTLAPAYNENFYYNIGLQTGDKLTLKSFFGENYADSIKENVEKQIIKRMEEDDNLVYNLDWFSDIQITDDRSFYINENGDIVIVFAKYEIASGAMGPQEFVVGNIDQIKFPEKVTIIGEEILSTDARYVSSTSNTITLNIEGQEITLQSMMGYDYEEGQLLKVKFVLEDGKRWVMLQCYPASNRIELTVSRLYIDKEEQSQEEKTFIQGETVEGKTYITSFDQGIEINSEKDRIVPGDQLEIYYGEITDDKLPRIWSYVINHK